MNNNIFKIEGVIYSKPVRTVESKTGGEPWEYKSIVMEVKGDKGKSDLLEFRLGFGANDNGFDVGQKIVMHFGIGGREWNGQYYTTLYARKAEHPDIQGDDTRDLNGEPPWASKKKSPPVIAPELPMESTDDEEAPF